MPFSRVAKKKIEFLIFNVKWLLNVFYIGLIAVLFLYAWAYIKDVYQLIVTNGLTTNNMMLSILELVDVVMIANLVKMIITGSYHSFVSKTHGMLNEDISSGMLKVKMSSSIVGVSSIHLLQTFVNSENVAWDVIHKQIWIHGSFLVGTFMLAVIEWMHVKGEVAEKQVEQEHNKGRK